MSNLERQILKRLYVSIVMLVACVLILSASTYSWFTDSIKSNNNVLISGNIELSISKESGFLERINNFDEILTDPYFIKFEEGDISGLSDIYVAKINVSNTGLLDYSTIDINNEKVEEFLIEETDLCKILGYKTVKYNADEIVEINNNKNDGERHLDDASVKELEIYLTHRDTDTTLINTDITIGVSVHSISGGLSDTKTISFEKPVDSLLSLAELEETDDNRICYFETIDGIALLNKDFMSKINDSLSLKLHAVNKGEDSNLKYLNNDFEINYRLAFEDGETPYNPFIYMLGIYTYGDVITDDSAKLYLEGYDTKFYSYDEFDSIAYFSITSKDLGPEHLFVDESFDGQDLIFNNEFNDQPTIIKTFKHVFENGIYLFDFINYNYLDLEEQEIFKLDISDINKSLLTKTADFFEIETYIVNGLDIEELKLKEDSNLFIKHVEEIDKEDKTEQYSYDISSGRLNIFTRYPGTYVMKSSYDYDHYFYHDECHKIESYEESFMNHKELTIDKEREVFMDLSSYSFEDVLYKINNYGSLKITGILNEADIYFENHGNVSFFETNCNDCNFTIDNQEDFVIESGIYYFDNFEIVDGSRKIEINDGLFNIDLTALCSNEVILNINEDGEYYIFKKD